MSDSEAKAPKHPGVVVEPHGKIVQDEAVVAAAAMKTKDVLQDLGVALRHGTIAQVVAEVGATAARAPYESRSACCRERGNGYVLWKGSDTDDSRAPKQSKSTLGFFEEFLNVLKSKAGDRESFTTMNNVIPEFDPLSKEQTVNIWLDKVDECTEIYNWTDRQTVHYALPKLSGIAKTWYQGLPSIKHSWSEWKVMLRESFPATENYAELLTEMLGRRVRPGESFELYYFSKINLLNRCKIFGKQAVDCLLHGIDDRGVRVGAQAAKFDRPEDVLEFFKTIKHHRTQSDTHKDFNRDKRSNVHTLGNSNSARISDTNSAKNNNTRGPVICFNCNGVGHPSFKCLKPLVKCSNCSFLGHESSHCPRSKEHKNPPKDKNILEVSLTDSSNDKYRLFINVNGVPAICQLDLGSEATLVRENEAKRLGLSWTSVDGPFLRGLGNVPYLPLGRTLVDIDVQGISEPDVEVFVVDDHLIKFDILLGHSYTERPTVKIIKTPSYLKFERTEESEQNSKLHLTTIGNITLEGSAWSGILSPARGVPSSRY
uniref:CCHC-type domain-containing protein n=2 Tax=Heliothis virescens TaxID=7102 RepID=A0A2A4K619_HELVI